MVELGEIRKVKSKGAERLYCLVLHVHKSSRSARVALISEIDTPNCSQIYLGNDLRLYPAIQGTLSTDSLEPSGLRDADEVNPQILSLTLGWPSYRQEDKKSVERDFSLILKLGDANLPFAEEFNQKFEEFSQLSHAHLLSNQLGMQMHESYLLLALRSGDLSKLRNTNSLNAALYSTPSLGGELKKSINSANSDVIRFAIRRAIHLRAEPLTAQVRKDKTGEMSRYFDFMRINGIYTMTVGFESKSEFRQSVKRRGPYTLRFAEMKVG